MQPDRRYPADVGNVRVSKRFVIGSAALLVGGSFVSLGGVLYYVVQDLRATRETLAELRKHGEQQREEIDELKTELLTVGDRLLSVRELEREARQQLRERLEAELSRQAEGEREGVKRQLAQLEGEVQGLVEAAQEHAKLLAASKQDASVEVRYRELMSPTVRVQSKTEVGSGSILWSRKTGRRGALSYVLTAWHIVADAFEGDDEPTLEVDFYSGGTMLRTERAKVVAHHEGLDLAVLEVRGYHVYPTKARIPARTALPSIPIFSKVYAIGCPLGYSPLPTSGELTSKDKELDGNQYWMINAPTIFGNSGGGIYLADSRTMIGVLSRISAYKNMIDVAVPHMGLVTPMNQVYDWLDSTRYGFVYRDRLEELASTAQKAAPKTTKRKALPASSAQKPR